MLSEYRGLLYTVGTVFEKNLQNDTSYLCIQCEDPQAYYVCQICLKLGVPHVRFCGENCFLASPSEHKRLHGRTVAKAKRLAREQVEVAKKLLENKTDLWQNKREIETLEQKESKLTVEIEALRLSMVVFQLQSQLSQVETELRDKHEEMVRFARDNEPAAEEEAVELPSECVVTTYEDLFARQQAYGRDINEVEQQLTVLQRECREGIKSAEVDRDQAVRKAELQYEMVKEIQVVLAHLKSADASRPARMDAVEAEYAQVVVSMEDERLLHARHMDEYAEKISELEERLVNDETERRILRNTISELRGNVRVFARVRPYTQTDGFDLQHPPKPVVRTSEDCGAMIISKPVTVLDKEMVNETKFNFDQCFGPSATQEDVFNEVSEFVQSALDGYNVCLFSYGQTGSGKTHTMQGIGNDSLRGIIPRAIEQVGHYKLELEAKGWEYSMEVSFIEIYNEAVRDLLREEEFDEFKHEIKRDNDGNTYISDVTLLELDPNKTEEIEEVLELAARYRSVGATQMNEQSSRSHSVFTLYLKASNAEQQVNLNGALSLVDLAGSERLDKSGSVGDRAKEAISINKSLTSLADVFTAIGNKQSFVPFRNSKLTYFLQPCLSGDGKTLMMVNLSPTSDSYWESFFAMKFASMVNKCELGRPKKQIKESTTTLSAGENSGDSPRAGGGGGKEGKVKIEYDEEGLPLPPKGKRRAQALPSKQPAGAGQNSISRY